MKYHVPQGSVLGPLLFLIEINHINHAIKFCKVHHFADDTNLVHFNKSVNKLNKYINIDMRLCPSISVKYLGAKIDVNLNWKYQTYNIVTKLNKANALLYKIILVLKL